jgi:hypothetical protein
LRGIYPLQIYLVSLISLIFQLYSDNLNSSAEGASEKLMIDCMLGKDQSLYILREKRCHT